MLLFVIHRHILYTFFKVGVEQHGNNKNMKVVPRPPISKIDHYKQEFTIEINNWFLKMILYMCKGLICSIYIVVACY